MTEKAKANWLYGKHYLIAMTTTNPKYRSSKVIKGHCILQVETIIEELESVSSNYDLNLYDDIKYWKGVLTELEKM